MKKFFNIKNKCGMDLSQTQELFHDLGGFAQKRFGFKKPPTLHLVSDHENASKPLGKTAYYDPAQKSITIYITGRHPKDIMRSISHELVHPAQNCRGEFDKPHQMGDGYAQNDSHMREMEREAYEVGNMCFRDWEDGLKNTIYLEHLQKGDKKMSTKDWKNKEITQLLSEAWGFKFNSLEEFDEFNGSGELQAEGEEDIEEIAGVSPRKQDRRTPKLQRDRRSDSDRDEDEKVDEVEEIEEEIDESEQIDELGALGAAATGALAGKMMGKRDDEEDDEDDEEKNESVDPLQEAIANLLRKKLKG